MCYSSKFFRQDEIIHGKGLIDVHVAVTGKYGGMDSSVLFFKDTIPQYGSSDIGARHVGA